MIEEIIASGTRGFAAIARELTARGVVGPRAGSELNSTQVLRVPQHLGLAQAAMLPAEQRPDAQALQRAEALRPLIEELVAAGVGSLSGIASQLTARGVARPAGGRWDAGSVSRIADRLGISLPRRGVLPAASASAPSHARRQEPAQALLAA